ncbi:MAG: DNA primase [Clostridia bacterium]|nr:DNA primase [Clostridia bacterium]
MLYPREVIEEVRLRNDIVEVIREYVPLKKQGSSYFGLCPFHNENTPSFSVNPEKQLFYCFGCGAAGNVIGFIMKIEGIDFVEALKKLADRAGYKLPEAEYTKEEAEKVKLREELYEIHKQAGLFFYKGLHSSEGNRALEYVNKRKISLSIQKKFGLGYAPNSKAALYEYLKNKGFSEKAMLESGLIMADKYKHGFHDRFYNRLMFPIFDVRGRCIAFGGRIMEKGEPKYLNSPETMIFSKKRNLYGLNFAKTAKKKEIIIVEGYMDLITIFQAGFKNVAASLGTAFNHEHAMLLKKFVSDVILVFDSDQAGENAALRAIPILVDGGFRVRVMQVPDGKDPDEFIKSKGSLEFGKLLVDAVSYMTFQINCAKKKYNMADEEQKILFTREAAKLISSIHSPIEREVYIKQISKETGISDTAVIQEISDTDKKRDRDFYYESKRKKIQNFSSNISVKNSISNSSGVIQAQKNIIFLCCDNTDLYFKIKKFLKADDFPDSDYSHLMEYASSFIESGKNIIPADAVSIFDTDEKQQKAAAVFSANVDYSSSEELSKALTEEIRLIKRSKLDCLASSATTIEQLQKIIKAKKEIEDIDIKL